MVLVLRGIEVIIMRLLILSKLILIRKQLCTNRKVEGFTAQNFPSFSRRGGRKTHYQIVTKPYLRPGWLICRLC
jgi:hypothetical protein